LILVGHEQADEKVGGGAAERDFPDHRERREPESAARASAQDEPGRAGDCERGQRFIFYVLADIAIAAMAASGPFGTHQFNSALGNAFDYLRDDVADREGGGDCDPRLAADEFAQIEVADPILNVLLGGVVAVFQSVVGAVGCVAAVIDRAVRGRICGVFKCHCRYLLSRREYLPSALQPNP
jgi:hypothetical protein